MNIFAGFSVICDDIARVGRVIQDICYHNARNYFNWQYIEEPQATTVKA